MRDRKTRHARREARHGRGRAREGGKQEVRPTGRKQEQGRWLEGVQGEREKPLPLFFLMRARLLLESSTGLPKTQDEKSPEHVSPTEVAVPKSCGHSDHLRLHWSFVHTELWPQTLGDPAVPLPLASQGQRQAQRSMEPKGKW